MRSYFGSLAHWLLKPARKTSAWPVGWPSIALPTARCSATADSVGYGCSRPGDAGGALGAALCAYHLFRGQPRQVDGEHDLMQGSYLGPEFRQSDIEERLARAGARFTRLTDDQLIDRTVGALADGKAIGWYQGRIEFGPRALGARSILGDPRSPSMQSVLNLKIKHRESFRLFVPSVLREDVADWFELDSDSPYMLMVADVAKQHRREMTAEEHALFGIQKLNVPRSSIPAVTHVDYSARIQTVHCAVIVNTSFNVRGEPIVLTPEDAFRCFMGTDIDVLAAGNCFLLKEDQNPRLRQDYRNAFSPD